MRSRSCSGTCGPETACGEITNGLLWNRRHRARVPPSQVPNKPGRRPDSRGRNTMTRNLSRREFGGLLAGMTAASTLASVGAFAQAGTSVRLIWWGNPDRDRRTNEVIDLYAQGDRDRGGAGDLRLERLLAEARDPGGGEEPAGPDPDGLPLHLRVRAPPAARRARRVHRQARSSLDDFDPNQLELRQGRRQALRHLDGRQLDDLRLQPGAARQARDRAARPDDLDQRRLRGDRHAGQGPAARGHVSRSRTWATGSRGWRTGCASAARRSTTRTASSATSSPT